VGADQTWLRSSGLVDALQDLEVGVAVAGGFVLDENIVRFEIREHIDIGNIVGFVKGFNTRGVYCLENRVGYSSYCCYSCYCYF
jgi:hypothetical protein